MPMEDNINEIYRARQELAIRNDDLTSQIRQLSKKVEILENQRKIISAERKAELDEFNKMRRYITDKLTDMVRALDDNSKIELLIRLTREAERKAEHGKDGGDAETNKNTI